MLQNLRNTFLMKRFYIAFGACILICLLGFLWPFLFNLSWVLLALLTIVTLYDTAFLYQTRKKIKLQRQLPNVLSLGDITSIVILIKNNFPYLLNAEIIDELPIQFQERNFVIPLKLAAHSTVEATYTIKPNTRGVHNFGKCNLFLGSKIGLINFRQVFDLEASIPVYPSVIQMKKHELNSIHQVEQFHGVKKFRRLGHSYEFEQIKNYVIGDDIRSVNWKATGRKGELMVNQFGDEKSQQVYSIIDRSRVMMLPFNGMSLMDYAINTALVISNIALKKQDKAGLVSFDQKIRTIVKADNRSNQLKRIIEALYNESESSLEANYELLYMAAQRVIKQRSLLILYTNFESQYALARNLPILRRINQRHVLLVVFFENSELDTFASLPGQELSEVYNKAMASKMLLDKKKMLKQLNQYGIQTLLTQPEDLSINTVNQYLAFKAKGLI
jgi:uncharacterized protein (DUF58 family)